MNEGHASEEAESEEGTSPAEGAAEEISAEEGAEAPEESAAPSETDTDPSAVSGEAASSAESEADGDSEDAEEELPALVPVLEAALFASAEAVPLKRLTRVLGAWTRKQIVAGLKELQERQEREGSGVRVVETAGGYQLRSVSEYAPWVRKFFTEKPPRLSRAVLETLAIVAYRQPATRGEVEAVRGVNCDAVLGALTARGLIQVMGRRPSPGRPVEYGTTAEFLELFSMKELGDLPPLPDPAALANLAEQAEESDSDGAPDEEAVLADSDGGASESPSDEPGEAGDPEESPEAMAAEEGAQDETNGGSNGATSEDPESGGDRVTALGGSVDPGGTSSGQREGDSRAGGEGGPQP